MQRRLVIGMVVAVVLTACGAGEPAPAPEPGPQEEPEPVARCGPVEQPPLQTGGHLIGDQEPPVPYSSVPPTSGWHASGAFSIAVHAPDDPLTEAQQVSVLEAGGVVVSYSELPGETRAELEDHVRENHEGRVAVTPYDELDPGQVAFTAWATLQRCDGVDLSVLDAFVDEHAEEEPGVPGTH